MPQITDKFWTDGVQAGERLRESIINYDGQAVKVITCDDETIGYRDHKNRKKFASMDDPKWSKFRDIPKCGWYNAAVGDYTGAAYLKRNAVRTRSHGLNRNNCIVYFVYAKGVGPSRDYAVHHVVQNEVFVESQQGEYPTFEQACQNVRKSSGLAISPLYCIVRDSVGNLYLFRKLKKVGMILEPETVHIYKKYRYLREEMLESVCLPDNLKEV